MKTSFSDQIRIAVLAIFGAGESAYLLFFSGATISPRTIVMAIIAFLFAPAILWFNPRRRHGLLFHCVLSFAFGAVSVYGWMTKNSVMGVVAAGVFLFGIGRVLIKASQSGRSEGAASP